MKTVLIIMSVLSILGIILTLLAGFWINNHESLIADLSNLFNFHRLQAFKTIIFTIITLVLAIVRKQNEPNSNQ